MTAKELNVLLEAGDVIKIESTYPYLLGFKVEKQLYGPSQTIQQIISKLYNYYFECEVDRRESIFKQELTQRLDVGPISKQGKIFF